MTIDQFTADDGERVPVAVVRGAVKSFQVGHEPVRGLQGFDLDLHAGEVCALVGISGSGKSTLLSVLGGLQCLDDGSVIVNGTDLAEFPTTSWPGIAPTRRPRSSRSTTCSRC